MCLAYFPKISANSKGWLWGEEMDALEGGCGLMSSKGRWNSPCAWPLQCNLKEPLCTGTEPAPAAVAPMHTAHVLEDLG
jgi:hypothetical protein